VGTGSPATRAVGFRISCEIVCEKYIKISVYRYFLIKNKYLYRGISLQNRYESMLSMFSKHPPLPLELNRKGR